MLSLAGSSSASLFTATSSCFGTASCEDFRDSASSGSADFLAAATCSAAGASSFLLFPLGAGSRGVRQYVTVRVTTWRTLTLPGFPLASGSASRGLYVALQGAALRGVPE